MVFVHLWITIIQSPLLLGRLLPVSVSSAQVRACHNITVVLLFEGETFEQSSESSVEVTSLVPKVGTC